MRSIKFNKYDAINWKLINELDDFGAGGYRSEIDRELEKIFKSNVVHSALCMFGCMITGLIFVHLHDNDPNKDMIITRFLTCLACFVLIYVEAVHPNKILFDLVRSGQGEKVRRWCRYKTVAFYLNLFFNTRCQFASYGVGGETL